METAPRSKVRVVDEEDRKRVRTYFRPGDAEPFYEFAESIGWKNHEGELFALLARMTKEIVL